MKRKGGEARRDLAPLTKPTETLQPKPTTRTVEMQSNHCSRTCRDTHPDDPRVWCDGCCIDEAEDREANMRRWQESEERRIPNNHWIDQHGAIHLMPRTSK